MYLKSLFEKEQKEQEDLSLTKEIAEAKKDLNDLLSILISSVFPVNLTSCDGCINRNVSKISSSIAIYSIITMPEFFTLDSNCGKCRTTVNTDRSPFCFIT